MPRVFITGSSTGLGLMAGDEPAGRRELALSVNPGTP